MPYGTETLGEYTKLVSGTHVFSYNKIVGIAILLDASVDYSDPTVWESYANDAATMEGKVAIIPKVIGTYDGGNPTTDKGYGNKLEVVTQMTHTIDFRTEYNKINTPFVENLMLADNAGIAFFTGDFEELTVVTGVNVSFANLMPVTDEMDKPREFNYKATWSKIKLPRVVAHNAAVAGLFK